MKKLLILAALLILGIGFLWGYWVAFHDVDWDFCNYQSLQPVKP